MLRLRWVPARCTERDRIIFEEKWATVILRRSNLTHQFHDSFFSAAEAFCHIATLLGLKKPTAAMLTRLPSCTSHLFRRPVYSCFGPPPLGLLQQKKITNGIVNYPSLHFPFKQRNSWPFSILPKWQQNNTNMVYGAMVNHNAVDASNPVSSQISQSIVTCIKKEQQEQEESKRVR